MVDRKNVAERWRRVLIAGLVFIFGYLAISEFPLLPDGVRLGFLRLLPTAMRSRYIEYVLADKVGFLRIDTDKVQMIGLIERAESDRRPIISNYDLLIPYAAYYMADKYNVVTEYPEGERTAEATTIILRRRDERLLEKTFAFHAGDARSILALCQDFFYSGEGERLSDVFDRHCKALYPTRSPPPPSGDPRTLEDILRGRSRSPT